jgi:diguanylate cyclase (GGDEF)-like protein
MGYFIIIVTTLTELKKALEQERVLSRTDGLTGLLNSRSFMEIFERRLLEFRQKRDPLTLSYIDLDNFKQVNDRFGHDVGDKVLKIVAHLVNRQMEVQDIFARMGGDEFCILMPGRDRKNIEKLLNHIRQKLRLQMRKNKWPVTFSIGLVICRKRYPEPRDIIKIADALMYSVKRSGKDGFLFREI